MPYPHFETYLDASGPDLELPTEIASAYGRFGLPERVVYANFVESLDGVVAVPELPRSSALISRGDPGDRFLVGLLRAVADVVLIGAGTLRAHRGPWTAENAYADASEDFANLRRNLGRSPYPTLVVVSGSGQLAGSASKLHGGIVVTTDDAAKALRDALDASTEIVSGSGPLHPNWVVAMLRDRGYRRILTEGGPTLAGQLVKERAVDELFLTMSPLLIGGGDGRPRATLAAGVDLVPGGPVDAQLVSARRSDSHLYLRYRIAH